jgi:hypothetical protein
MSDLDHEIRRGLERLTDPAGASGPLTFDRVAARRRQRRIRRAALAALPAIALLAIVAGVMTRDAGGRVDIATGEDTDVSSPSGTDGAVTVQRTEVLGGDGGTARVVMEFDGPLPGREIRYSDDVPAGGAGDAILYTIQDAGSVQVCDSVHSFPPPAEGTVDFFIPADWFADGVDTHTSPLETIANPAKFVSCGPHDGYFQYSTWGPVSVDRSDVAIAVDPDGRRLTVQIGPPPTQFGDEVIPFGSPTLDQAGADAAQSVVTAFLADLRDGDLTSAAQRWSGYPELGPDAPPAERIPYIEELLSDPAFTRILGAGTEIVVTPSWGFSTAAPVVTVLAPRHGDDPPVAVAFLVGGLEQDPETVWIHRLPATGDGSMQGLAGSRVEPGQEIVIPGVPIEGGARAFVGRDEIPVAVDLENSTMAITVPEGVDGDIAVTISTATPELPGADAFAVTVGSP